MPQQLSNDTLGELYKNLLQHMKCIEVRLDYAKVVTSHKQKHTINIALTKMRSAIDNVCDILGDTNKILKVKKELDKADLVYIMLLTEQLFCIPPNDLEELTDLIEKHLNDKYGSVEPK
jgi:hypothetical protein